MEGRTNGGTATKCPSGGSLGWCAVTLAVETGMKLTKQHPLVGTWITADEDSDSAFVVNVTRGRFVVSGFCRSDSEKFRISNTTWDGHVLSFESFMPSTRTKATHSFAMRSDGRIDHQLTIWEIWKKKKVRPGQIPDAWKIEVAANRVQPLELTATSDGDGGDPPKAGKPS